MPYLVRSFRSNQFEGFLDFVTDLWDRSEFMASEIGPYGGSDFSFYTNFLMLNPVASWEVPGNSKSAEHHAEMCLD